MASKEKRALMLAVKLQERGFHGVIVNNIFKELKQDITLQTDTNTYYLPNKGDITILSKTGEPILVLDVFEFSDTVKIDKTLIQDQIAFELNPIPSIKSYKHSQKELKSTDNDIELTENLETSLKELGAVKSKSNPPSNLREYLTLIFQYLKNTTKDRKEAVDMLEKVLGKKTPTCEDNYFVIKYFQNFFNQFNITLQTLDPNYLKEMLSYTRKEEEFNKTTDFGLTLLQSIHPDFKPDTIYMPFINTGIDLLQIIQTLQPKKFIGCGDKQDLKIKNILEKEFNTEYQISSDYPEEIIMKKPEQSDLILLYPPYESYINDTFINSHFSFSELQGNRKKIEVEVLSLEHCLKHLKPGGEIIAFLTGSFLSSKRFSDIRERLLKETDLRAIINLPPGTLHPKWGYQVSFVYMKKLAPDTNPWDKTLMGTLPNLNPEEISKVLAEFKKGVTIHE